MRVHHVQVMMPTGGDAAARAFWVDGIGLTEVPKPPVLAARGGSWFRSWAPDGSVSVEIHVSPDDDFVAAGRAHPALVVDSLAELEALGERLQAAGHRVSWAERETFAGYLRFHCWDPFGNRVEGLTPRGD